MKINPTLERIILVSILAAGIFLSVREIYISYTANHGFGFPLDDPWIHLQFARNLHDYGSFSYYKNEMVTSGSTSPLYTVLLAAGFLFTSNEMILSYSLGIASLAFAAMMMYLLAKLLFKGNVVLASSAALLLVLEPHLQWAAISGMETTLFIAILLSVMYFYLKKEPIPFGISSGLLLWTRPEALILFGVIAGIILYEAFLIKRPKSKGRETSRDAGWLKKCAPYAAAIILAYFLFNFILSGSIFPNTYAAKIKYYSGSNSNFTAAALQFISGGHFLIPSLLAAISALGVIWKLLKRKSSPMLVILLWSIMLYVAYDMYLPMLYQNGRYLIPLLPSLLLLSLDGLEEALMILKKIFASLEKPALSAAISIIVIFVFAFWFGSSVIRQTDAYSGMCRYITDRQVQTALWMRSNLPPDAVIATHDIGAIAYYSDRRVVDMVGLVSPEMIKNIGSFDLLINFLAVKNVTHIAALRNWFEVVNALPLFQTDPRYYEVMQVFKFDPSGTRFAPQQTTKLNDAGEYYLLAGDVANALIILRRSIFMYPHSARTNYLLGRAELAVGNLDAARERFESVLELQPDFPGIGYQINNLKKVEKK